MIVFGEKISKDQDRIEKATKRYYERAEKLSAFIKDLRGLFYHGLGDDCDILFRTELKDIDNENYTTCWKTIKKY